MDAQRGNACNIQSPDTLLVMLRRSIRLAAAHYYNSGDESDSSMTTNILYRENPVKVFKKKARKRKRAAAGPSSVPPPPPTIRPGPTPSRSKVDLSMGDVSDANPSTNAQPALSSASSATTRSPMPSPVSTSTSTSTSVAPVAPAVGYRHRINSALSGVKDLLSTLTAKINHVTAFAYRSIIGALTKKVFIALILLFVVAACVWLLPLLRLSLSTPLLGFIKALSETNKVMEPLLPNIILPSPNTSAKDSVTLIADQELKLQNHLKREKFEVEMQSLRNNFKRIEQVRDKLLTDTMQMREEFEVSMQSVRGNLKTVKSNIAVNLDRQVTVMSKKMDDQKLHFQSLLGHSVGDRIKALETQIAELSKELLSIQSQPPALPYPDISAQKQLTPEFQQAMGKWLTDHMQAHDAVNLKDKGVSSAWAQPFSNRMSNFALESQGAHVISTRCSETYHTRPASVSLFGFPLWYPPESPRTVIQGEPMLPGNCWAFRGAHGNLAVALSHPIRITHVTLEHVPREITPTGRIDSAPKDFEVYGLKDEVEEGTLLGTFTYDEDGEPTQTFELSPSDVIYRMVELHVLSNWGHMEYTCLYRFRVHGTWA
ncbi:cytochrome P450 2U1 isoform X1 [Festucalex cinctus]